MSSTGNESSTDQSGFSLKAQVAGDYPCTKTIFGAVNLEVFIGQEMDMTFGLDGMSSLSSPFHIPKLAPSAS